ncbi:MAG: rod shape-determining protein MreC [Candidatus Sungbacteria bacterium]|nr:rod shape-determining protein MreC [Candidatus Sungbacteria bacterium]
MLNKNSLLRMALMAVAVTLLVFLGASARFDPWRSRATSAIVPVLSFLRSSADFLRTLVGGAEIEALTNERNLLLAKEARWKDALSENEALRQALAMRKTGESGVIVARVVGFFREGRSEFVTLDRGTESGVAEGDIVVSQSRVLAGTIVSVGIGFSRVLLLTSPSKSVDVVVGDIKAIAKGNNSRELIIDLVPPDAEVKIGDAVRPALRASSGQGGIIIGVVREVKRAENEVFKSVKAFHLFDPAEDNVLILSEE